MTLFKEGNTYSNKTDKFMTPKITMHEIHCFSMYTSICDHFSFKHLAQFRPQFRNG